MENIEQYTSKIQNMGDDSDLNGKMKNKHEKTQNPNSKFKNSFLKNE